MISNTTYCSKMILTPVDTLNGFSSEYQILFVTKRSSLTCWMNISRTACIEWAWKSLSTAKSSPKKEIYPGIEAGRTLTTTKMDTVDPH